MVLILELQVISCIFWAQTTEGLEHNRREWRAENTSDVLAEVYNAEETSRRILNLFTKG